MKRTQLVALMLICFVAGLVTAYLAGGRIAEAQNGQVGRYQLFEGRYRPNVPGVEAETLILKLDTVNGKAQTYYSGVSGNGKLIEGWRPVPDTWPPVESSR